MGVMDTVWKKAKDNIRTIVLPETEDERVIKAAAGALKEKLAKIVLVGKPEDINASAAKLGVDISGAKIVNPGSYERFEAYAEELVKLREKKGMTLEKAREILLSDCRYFGAMMVKIGEADGMVAGSNSPTADVIRASLQVIGTKKGLKTVSSCFIMVTDKKEYGDEGVLIFSDCGVVPNPTAEQLADIATSAAESARSFANMTPRVGLLSFSTKGSASHENVTKVTEAVRILKERNVDFEFDGELQADAALVPKVGAKKAPGSTVAGRANVLVFPDLQSGNIGYKLVERFAEAEAFGPILQGLDKPVNDLSRGCSAEDIVNVIAITSVMA